MASSSLPPLPPRNRIRYKRSDDFAFCRQCLTHVALMGLGEGESKNMVMFGNRWFLFKNTVNLRLDEVHELSDGATTVRATYCKNCGADLGFKLMSLRVQDDILREGRYFLNGLKMLVWFDTKMWFGHTLDEIEDTTLTAIAEHHLNFRT